MWKSFEKLAQANVDHYTDHPTQHNIMLAAYGMVAVVVIGWLGKKIGTMNTPKTP